MKLTKRKLFKYLVDALSRSKYHQDHIFGVASLQCRMKAIETPVKPLLLLMIKFTAFFVGTSFYRPVNTSRHLFLMPKLIGLDYSGLDLCKARWSRVDLPDVNLGT